MSFSISLSPHPPSGGFSISRHSDTNLSFPPRAFLSNARGALGEGGNPLVCMSPFTGGFFISRGSSSSVLPAPLPSFPRRRESTLVHVPLHGGFSISRGCRCNNLGTVPKCTPVTETEPPEPFCLRRGVLLRGAPEGCSSRVFLCNTSGVPRRRRESISPSQGLNLPS